MQYGQVIDDEAECQSYLERIRIALGGYKDSDLASLATTLKARCDALEAEAARLQEALAYTTGQRDGCRAEVERLWAQVATLKMALVVAAKYVAKAHADGAFANTAMSGDRALRIINEALDNTRQDAP